MPVYFNNQKALDFSKRPPPRKSIESSMWLLQAPKLASYVVELVREQLLQYPADGLTTMTRRHLNECLYEPPTDRLASYLVGRLDEKLESSAKFRAHSTSAKRTITERREYVASHMHAWLLSMVAEATRNDPTIMRRLQASSFTGIR